LIKTINDVRYTMWATVIPKFTGTNQQILTPDATAPTGSYVKVQDPDSGEITETWVAGNTVTAPPGTPEYLHNVKQQLEVPCYVRGFTNLGFRSSANREILLHGDYTIIESVQFDYPADVKLDHQSLVTNIRSNEELDPTFANCIYKTETGKPTVWEVQGITPVVDPFGYYLRNTTVLRRAEVQ
jgi:hypothetical protein